MSSNVADIDDSVGPGILDITLKSDKKLKSVRVKILTAGGYTVHEDKETPDAYHVNFRAPKELCLTGLTLRLEYSHSREYTISSNIINVTGEDLRSVYKPGFKDEQIWERSYGKLNLRVKLEDPFRPTTERILEVCPQFRILVAGKSGVGKSSLINKVFNITDALVSDTGPGDAEINREFTSEKNPHLVLHDTRGFEPGEDVNFQTVRDFIERRGKEPEIKKKLHAIWLCVQAPLLNSRTIETGVEKFLKLKANGELGDVPIIVVFTKYDTIVAKERWDGRRANKNLTLQELMRNASERLQQECFAPFEESVGKTIPYLAVSVRAGYADTLNDLVKITFESVGEYIAEAAIVTGISQRINAQVKIRTSIEVGRRGHWKELMSNKDLPITLETFLGIIHQDIVKVWNMEDTKDLLRSLEFKKLMLNSVNPPENQINPVSKSIREAVEIIMTILSGPIGPIMIPAMKMAYDWAHERFIKTPGNLRRVTIYIFNLTIVMQNLFWIQNILAMKQVTTNNFTSVTAPIKCRLIKLAFNLYFTASDRGVLLTEIDKRTTWLRSLHQSISEDRHNETINEVIDLIKDFTVNTQDALIRQNKFELDDSWKNDGDEVWDVQTGR